MKRLIINADDFGLTAGVNRAIAEAHQRGVVTSASMMAGGAQLDEAFTMRVSVWKLADARTKLADLWADGWPPCST